MHTHRNTLIYIYIYIYIYAVYDTYHGVLVLSVVRDFDSGVVLGHLSLATDLLTLYVYVHKDALDWRYMHRCM